MDARWLPMVLASASACFSPTVPTGVPCAENGACPGNQVCELTTNICGGSPRDAGDDSSDDPDDAMPDVMPDMMMSSQGWGAPAMLDELVVGGNAIDPAISQNGLEIYFASSRDGTLDIWRATRATRTSDFTDIEKITTISTADSESAPTLALDDLVMWFRRGTDIYFTQRTNVDSAWSTAVLDDELSSADNDFDPGVSPDGLVAIVARAVPDNQRDLYGFSRTEPDGSWSIGVLLGGALRSDYIDSGAAFDGVDETVWFHSARDTAINNRSDLFFVAVGPGSSQAYPIIELNTVPATEEDPTLTFDGKLIIFSRDGVPYQATRP